MFKKFIDQIYNIYEKIFTNISFLSFLYMKFHEPSVKKEINMAEISQADKILHIGCGAIPYSLIIFSKETHTQITGIDNQTRSIAHAKKFIADDKNIHVEKASGETYDVSPFDVVLISYGVGDIEAVLKNTLQHLKNNGKVILRKPITETTEYIDTVLESYSIKKIKLLLSQESYLLMKKQAAS
jgi:precorrin-6B methylase 2